MQLCVPEMRASPALCTAPIHTVARGYPPRKSDDLTILYKALTRMYPLSVIRLHIVVYLNMYDKHCNMELMHIWSLYTMVKMMLTSHWPFRIIPKSETSEINQQNCYNSDVVESSLTSIRSNKVLAWRRVITNWTWYQDKGGYIGIIIHTCLL